MFTPGGFGAALILFFLPVKVSYFWRILSSYWVGEGGHFGFGSIPNI